MCRRLIFLISFVLVLSIGSVANAALEDGLLVFHDFGGLTDDSGNGHDAELFGTATISGGYLELDGTEGTYALVGEDTFGSVNPAVDALSDFTIAIVYNTTQDVQNMLLGLGPVAGNPGGPDDGSGDLSLFGNTDGVGYHGVDHWWWGFVGSDDSGIDYTDGTDHLLVVTYTEADDTYTFYHLEGGSAVAHGGDVADWADVWDDALDYAIGLGTSPNPNAEADFGPPGTGDWAYFDGNIDKFAIWDRALDTSEMPGILDMEGGGGGPSNPNPKDKEERVDPEGLVLTWTPDPCSATEDVYFSSNFDDVNDACAAAWQATQLSSVNDWPTVGDLGDDVNLNEWYYWRIDEANAASVFDACGPVWSFKVKGPNSALPSPEDEAYAGPCVILTWDAGAWAAEHYVYFDVNEANVIGRVGPCTPLTEPCPESYDPPGALGWDETYYWAVDENDVCDVVTAGEVWSFTVPRDPCDGPEWRYDDDTLYAIWGFNNWVIGTDPCVASDYNSYPVGDYTFEPNCVDGPNQVLASYAGRDHVADNNGPAGEVGENSIRLKHTDNASPGQNVMIRAGMIWSGDNPPTAVVLERLTNFENGPPVGGSEEDIDDWWEAWNEGDNVKDSCEPEPEFTIELCDGWMYSVYEITYRLTTPADNIHVVIESSGAFYVDSVMVDAQWWTPPEAHGPSPADGATGVLLDLCKLTWYPGAYVDDHNVYFSETEALVADACDSAKVSNRQADPCYPSAAGVCLADVGIVLKPGTTYYWCVDEVNDPCLWEGAVWSFTTTPYVVIDDFNHYTDDPNMSETWIDHATQPTWGSYVYRSTNVEPNTSPPYSMKLQYYWKSTQPHLFTRRTFDPPQDWTKGGLAALVLQFYGDANSMFLYPAFLDRITATEMYVTLTDGQDNVWKEYYDGEANDLIAKEWMEWNLALSDFNESPNNVDTTNIKSIDIGVSGIVMSANKLMGRIWFDDIRLYVPRCVPMYAVDISSDPEGEFAGAPDCIVDGWDLDAMFNDWVVGDANVLSVDVCDANLLVHYTFDPCAAYDDLGNPWDSSGNNYHGIGINEPNVHAGILTLYGSNSVEIGGDFNDINPFRGAIKGGGDFTIAMKFRTEEQSIFFSSCPYDPDVNEANGHPNDTDPSNNAMAIFMLGEAVTYDNWYVTAASVTDSPTDNQWHFLVVTHDANGGITGEDPPGDEPSNAATGLTTVYLDGVAGEPVNFDPNLNVPTTHSIRIGTTRHPIMPYQEGEDIVDMTGDIDEVRIYDRVLPHGEIVNLMGVPAGQWFYMPVDSDADLYEDEPAATSLESTRFVNFKDYTFMMQYWLVEQLFPPED